MSGSVTAAVFLCQFLYWEGKQKNKGGWIYKTREDISAETGLSRYEQEGARKKLKSLRFLEEKLAGNSATVPYRLNLEATNGAWSEMGEFPPVENSPSGDTSQQDGGNTANKLGEDQPTIYKDAEITTETTTEIYINPAGLLGSGDPSDSMGALERQPGESLREAFIRIWKYWDDERGRINGETGVSSCQHSR